MRENILLVSAAVLFKKLEDGSEEWFLVKEGEDAEWEIPKSIARTGESSVRASIRALQDQAGMSVKVLEEVGRSGGAAKVNGKAVTQRTVYYLIQFKNGGEVLGYDEHEWLDSRKALARLSSKRDSTMLKDAKKLLKQVESDGRLDDEEEVADED